MPKGTVLGPVLYTVYNSDLPTHPDTLLASFADDTCKLAIDKTAHLTFTLHRQTCPPVLFNNVPTPTPQQVRYLGLH